MPNTHASLPVRPTAAGPRSNYLRCAGREIHFTEWGVEHSRSVIAWHGLARTGRDMDPLAAQLAQHYHVICPDTLGRGLSQWSPQPEQEYCLDFYVHQAQALANQLGLAQFHWVGTSMGGAIGMVAAATRLKGRILSLVLNDIGPEMAAPAVQRIRSYAGRPEAFDSVSELEQYFRKIYQPYGWISPEQWRLLTESSVRRLPDGRVTPHYDPAMAGQFEHHPDDYKLWSVWDQLNLPVLALRGEHSDLLLPEVAQAMRERGPRAQVVELPDCGHAPALNVPLHWDLIEQFLAKY
ncbi:pimeloyl-ACP methyl ester carboxylesterase [Paucibacter oligotrophus]|uniref:Pimeloyl-ACP methyl ester carboxylesterase n=1 Tax=Roseateles oligotrophus TaxID=1769250 RepID=A0A840LDL4_9BURK|nr:alpha/beta hydrolase [Roseateles oligotrophus]MBB4846260.1 pimeloyl-ACP methyl ester carboxylesterase [Roseateles oligotrophus]